VDVDCSRPTEKKKEGKEEKDYPRRYGRRLEKESKHGKSTVNTIQEETLDRYKRLRNEVNRAIRQEEDKIRKQILRGFKGNPKRFYGYMRNMKTVKDNLTVLRKDDGELTTTDQETADLISAYFKEVYTVEDLRKLCGGHGKRFELEGHRPGLWRVSSHEEAAATQLRQIAEPDAIHPLLLKECATVLAEPLSMICQQ